MSNFYMMAGLPGSGKTSYAIAHYDKETDVLLDSDAMRAELFGDETCQDNPSLVFSTMRDRAISALNSEKNVWYIATNISSKRRLALLHDFQQHVKVSYTTTIIIMATTPDECKRRNALRDRHVPNYVIDRMLTQFWPPMPNEPWDNIITIEDSDANVKASYAYICENVDRFGGQNNPHHHYSLAQHMLECAETFNTRYPQYDNISAAAHFHDIGKIFTATKWDKDNYTHYPNHSSVGAYYLMCWMPNHIEVAQLVAAHMIPFNKGWVSPYPEDFTNKLMALHEADKAAS